MNLANVKLLRRLILPLFARLNPGDITITHHFTGDKVFLHSFKHKGYWFYGKNREKDTMELFRRLIRPADTIIEIGGHIGYVSLYFANLANKGSVYVFEPGPNNLPYLKKNVRGKANVTVIEKGVGSANATLPFYVDAISGQNNSFKENFEGFLISRAAAYYRDAGLGKIDVDVVRLDDFIAERALSPSFVKIDVEGYELPVIQGMLTALTNIRPMLMVEIQDDRSEIYDIITNQGYVMFTDQLHVISNPDNLWFNTFCLHRIAHSPWLIELGLSQ